MAKWKPPPAPSGGKIVGYGQILIDVWFTGDTKNPTGEVAIRGNQVMPLEFYVLGCEHLMRLAATKSSAGFERALELLVEGAMEGRNVKLKPGPGAGA